MSLLRTFLLIVCTLVSTNLNANNSVKIGALAFQDPVLNIEQWTPVLDYLAKEVGVPFELVHRDELDDMVKDLASGKIDIMDGGVFTHIAATATGNASLLVGESGFSSNSKICKSVFIVRDDSHIQSLADLKGKTLVLSNKFSMLGYHVPLLMLVNAGIDSPDTFFQQIVLSGWHDRSIDMILEGAVDVAAIGSLYLSLLPKEKLDHLRIIAESEPLQFGIMTIRNDLDPTLRMKIYDALISFKDKVPLEIRKTTLIDEFYEIKESDLDTIRTAYDSTQALPHIVHATPYQPIPSLFAERVRIEKKRMLKEMIITLTLLVIILFASSFWARKKFSSSIGLLVSSVLTILFIFFSALHLFITFASINTLAAKKPGDLQSLNLRIVAAMSGASFEKLDQILLTARREETVFSAKVYRDGVYIASTDARDVGTSIIDRIRAKTFDVSTKNVLQVSDPIVIGDRKYATLQTGISYEPIVNIVNNAITINIITFFVILLTGIATVWIVKRRMLRPINDISSAVDGLREGLNICVLPKDAEIKQVASSIEKLGRELEEKEHLVELKTAEIKHQSKDCCPEVTYKLLERIHKMEDANEEFRNLRRTQVIGTSPAWLRTIRDAAIRARDKDPVVIIGPTGSGKTGIARTIHTLSLRSTKPFGEFNCAEFASADPMIVLGKLFGYGTDSGIATVDRKGQRGILEEYDGGTLFFDEAALLPPQAQQILLLPLEDRPFNPAAGKGNPRIVNIRFIFATNESLENLVHAGKMRLDLLRRIKSRGIVEIPPLAERREDIEGLALHFLAMRNLAANTVLSFDHKAINALSNFGFDKFNVSELKGVVDQAFDNAVFENYKKIEQKHLTKDIIIAENKPASPAKNNFDDDEIRELSALRMYAFNITRAEKHLGYASGAKTLTNRFRGITYKTLGNCEWNIEAAVSEIAGKSSDSKILNDLKKKIVGYFEMAKRHISEGSTDKLFTNLPQKYHSVVEKFLDKIRNS